jgi:uncharacterized protein involved in exopolysaccharide biosynthesis
MAKVSLRKETPLIQLIDKPILPLAKNKTGVLKSLLLGFVISIIFVSLYLILRRMLVDILS